MVKFGYVWSGMAEIHLVKSIIWMGQTNKKTNTHTKNDDMLSCCTTKNYELFAIYIKVSVGKLGKL